MYTYQGDPILAERFVVASSIFKYDGVFMEMHPRPKEAVSDADCQIPLSRLNTILKTHDNVEKATRGFQP